ncbi:DUF3427 domain-containing protein [Paraoerskovia marina]|uniref:DUF3427 domain-containing protein n=1 Tax=Paraoerskovia marina TaxID=545619 RepID=UPI001E560F42|nr:DEAD/DEAH box helicase [Paraoerskovia marina]
MTNDGSGNVLREIRLELKHATAFAFSVAFVTPSAIALLKQDLVDFQGRGTIITSDYLGFNTPEAFTELLNLERLDVEVRVHSDPAYHPKAYLFDHRATKTALIGSANLTAAALVRNHEWNIRVSASREGDLSTQMHALVQSQIARSTRITPEWIEQYRSRRVDLTNGARSEVREQSTLGVDANSADQSQAIGAQTTSQIVANQMQQDALSELARLRIDGCRRAAVISATGTGKTILSALDVRSLAPRRLLFVVHREQIIDRTIAEYRAVLGGSLTEYGKLSGGSKDWNARYLFATVQTISQMSVLEKFPRDEFDYVVIDEAHRAGAQGHRRVIEYFAPKFLLGMTATPERMDGFNIFALFDHNVAYEIRLQNALESGMLTPFHYYGVADVEYQNGRTVSEDTGFTDLVSSERIEHLVNALTTYGHAGVPIRGLIFCSRKQEARALSAALNGRHLRGRLLRTVALTGDDPVAVREAAVHQLECGDLDYLLTVDVFNEGVDIPSVNQVVMLRQTQSAIVFVQQLGRGLRKHPGKEYLIVIDFIGNYATNFLIPIALFGDRTLNKESLRRQLIASEESGTIAGISSVQFDRIAQDRVLASIAAASLDSRSRLQAVVKEMWDRVGCPPRLWDFHHFDSADPVVLANKYRNYPELLSKLFDYTVDFSSFEHGALQYLSAEVLASKRPHEGVVMRELLRSETLSRESMERVFRAEGLRTSSGLIDSVCAWFALDGFSSQDMKRYATPIARHTSGRGLVLDDAFRRSYVEKRDFRAAVDDLVTTAIAYTKNRFDPKMPFTVGAQYSRREALRQLCESPKNASTVYGYKVFPRSRTCPIFITLHKEQDVAASVAYADDLVDPSTMRWFSKSNRRLDSNELRPIIDGDIDLHVFVQRSGSDGSEFYYLGEADAYEAVQDSMEGNSGKVLPVVRFRLAFRTPIDRSLFDYLHPLVTRV